MAFSFHVQEKAVSFFKKQTEFFSSPGKLQAWMSKRFDSVVVAGLGSVPKPFFSFLKMYGLEDATKKSFEEFVSQSPFSVKHLRSKYFLELMNLCRKRNQKTNHQVFLFHLVAKFCGTQALARRILFNNFLDLPCSTFYLKQKSYVENFVQERISSVSNKTFVAWIDNFTKVHSVDFQVNDQGKSYSMKDLTVCCLFLPSTEINSTVYNSTFETLNSKDFSSIKVFDSAPAVAFNMLEEFETNSVYKRTSSNIFIFF